MSTYLRTGLYPGTFDPPTLGHREIISRAAKIVDRLIIGVARNAGKSPLFPLETRLRMVREEVADIAQKGTEIEVTTFDGLLMHFAASIGAHLIIRGLRAVSDFEYEFQMTGMNYRLDNSIETVFLMASDRHQFVASRFVKEIASLGGDVSPFVSPFVVQQLHDIMTKGKGREKVIPEVRD